MSDDDRERLEASVRVVLEAIISEGRAHRAQDSIEGMTDLPMKRPKRPRDPAQLAKLIVHIATGEVEDADPNAGKDQAAAALGRKGGAARAKGMPPERRAEIARKATFRS